MPSMAHALRCPSLTPTDSLKMRSRTFAPPYEAGLNNGGIDPFTGQVLANTMTVGDPVGSFSRSMDWGCYAAAIPQKTIQARTLGKSHCSTLGARSPGRKVKTVMVEQWLMSVKRSRRQDDVA